MVEGFAIGKIVKPHGLRGGMKAFSYLESDELLHDLGEIVLRRDGREGVPFKVRRITAGKKGFVLEVEGIEDADAAGQWTGCQVLAFSSVLKTLPEGEYYWRDLMGLDVVTEEGRFLGKIKSIFPTGSNDVYVCEGGEGEILLPALEDVIRQVDSKKGVMVVRLTKGL